MRDGGLMAVNRDPMSDTPGSGRPPLPEGWVYTEDVEWSAPRTTTSGPTRKRVWLGVVVALVAVCGAGLLVANAQRHYTRGVAALHEGAYVRAQAELSAARLVVVPYRDSALLEEHAADEVRLEAEETYTADARVDAVGTALKGAAAALKDRDAARFVDALSSVASDDLQNVLRSDPAARKAEQTLAQGLTTIVRTALSARKWDRAETWTAALLALEPASAEAATLSLKVKKGRELSGRLADARDAARRGQWRKALRLALGVAAVRRGFPGASTLIAEARRKLAPKPARTTAPASAATQPATTGGTTSSGSSSGSSSQPPPP